jgi:3-deoxy-D-arabino-heptulosonate 7-phosphate (DAHP) synthase
MGKHKYIESPEKMWELFEDYRKKTKGSPRRRMVFVGKDGSKEYEELETPLTFEGFYNYCYETIGCIDQYFENRDKRYKDYVAICSRIKKQIRQDQIEGGMVGQYNPSITQRLNGLRELTDSNINHNVEVLSIDPLDDTADNSTKEDSSAS